MENPYAPPSASLEGAEPSAGSPVKAVVIGLLIDIGGTMLAGIILVAIYAFVLAKAGVKERDIVEAMANIPHDSWVSIAGFGIGCLFSLLGGYVCARVARGSAQKAGHVMALLSVALGFLIAMDEYSLPMSVVLAVTTWASVMGGVYLGRIRIRAAFTHALVDVPPRDPA